jgi:hypothetical protein
LVPSGVVASNGWLHETLVGITTKHHPPAKL